MAADIFQQVKKTIVRFGMLRPHERVVVAVSGGADSVCLLHLLQRLQEGWDLYLVAAHFDHGWRPQEDAQETAFVEELCHGLGLPLEVRGAAPGPVAVSGSAEEHARRMRYRFLEEIRRRHHAHRIALGHTRNDQAETVLMRLLRGSGPAGLSGIPPMRDGIVVRPLLGVTRQAVEAYCGRHGLAYVTDSSNADPRYLRNRIRHELMPHLAEFQPRIHAILAQTADICRGEDAWLRASATAWLENHGTVEADDEIRFPIPPFRELHPGLARRVVRAAIARCRGNLRRISARQVDAVVELAYSPKAGGACHLPARLIVRKTPADLCFSRRAAPQASDVCYLVEGPGVVLLDAFDALLIVEELPVGAATDAMRSGRTGTEALLDAARVTFPLLVRNWRPGDRFVPSGMRGHKKLQDFFTDLKISRGDRNRIPLVIAGGCPIWVGGWRSDERFKVTAETRRVLRLRLDAHPAEGDPGRDPATGR